MDSTRASHTKALNWVIKPHKGKLQEQLLHNGGKNNYNGQMMPEVLLNRVKWGVGNFLLCSTCAWLYAGRNDRSADSPIQATDRTYWNANTAESKANNVCLNFNCICIASAQIKSHPSGWSSRKCKLPTTEKQKKNKHKRHGRGTSTTWGATAKRNIKEHVSGICLFHISVKHNF